MAQEPLFSFLDMTNGAHRFLAHDFYKRTDAERANDVFPVSYMYPPGAWQRHGASPTLTDNGPAINTALLCNSIAYDAQRSGPALYAVQTTIRFRSAGQILRGAGFGDNNTAAGAGVKFAPRTTLKWTGSAGGKVVSVSDGTTNWSETKLEDLCIDGNSLANKGIEGYDDSISGGCWRNVYRNVTVINCTSGTNPTAAYLGAATNFANDVILQECFLWACGIGVYTQGAVPQLVRTTIGNMSIAGLYMPGGGAEVKCYGGVFHGNSRDIDVGASGVIQNISAFGTWFENSTNGIFRAQSSFSLHFVGCHMHTSSATCLFDFGGQAGHAIIKGWCPAGSGSYAIINPNASYDYDLVGTGITVSDYKLRIAGANGLVRIDNADFLVGQTSDQTNATGDGTAVSMNSAAVTKDHDLSNAVGSSTGIFTAPATGYYEFNVNVALGNVGASHTDALVDLVVTGTSAQVFNICRLNPGACRTSGNETFFGGTVRVAMTKGDTAYPKVTVSGSTKTITVASGGTGTNWRTRFEGRLA